MLFFPLISINEIPRLIGFVLMAGLLMSGLILVGIWQNSAWVGLFFILAGGRTCIDLSTHVFGMDRHTRLLRRMTKKEKQVLEKVHRSIDSVTEPKARSEFHNNHKMQDLQ